MDENERIKEEGSVCCALANEERGQQDLNRQGPYTDGPFFRSNTNTTGTYSSPLLGERRTRGSR